jgi:hypothetical protein
MGARQLALSLFGSKMSLVFATEELMCLYAMNSRRKHKNESFCCHDEMFDVCAWLIYISKITRHPCFARDPVRCLTSRWRRRSLRSVRVIYRVISAVLKMGC